MFKPYRWGLFLAGASAARYAARAGLKLVARLHIPCFVTVTKMGGQRSVSGRPSGMVQKYPMPEFATNPNL